MPRGYRARPEQAILIKVKAWNTNCRQHIPQKFDAADVKAARRSRIPPLATFPESPDIERALPVRMDLISVGVKVGLKLKRRAAAPETKGVAMDVPFVPL